MEGKRTIINGANTFIDTETVYHFSRPFALAIENQTLIDSPSSGDGDDINEDSPLQPLHLLIAFAFILLYTSNRKLSTK